MRLSRQILSAPLRRLEELGSHRLLATLTQDIPAIGSTLVNIPTYDYAYLDRPRVFDLSGVAVVAAFFRLIGFIIVGTLSYQVPLRRGMRSICHGREEWDKLFKHFQALTSGVKELKLHHDRREAFFTKALYPTGASLRRHSMIGHLNFVGADSWGQSLFFILIGLILFTAYSRPGINAQTLIGYTLVILYMMNPIQVILTIIPSFATASVSMQKVEQLGLTLHESDASEEIQGS